MYSVLLVYAREVPLYRLPNPLDLISRPLLFLQSAIVASLWQEINFSKQLARFTSPVIIVLIYIHSQLPILPSFGILLLVVK